MPKPGDNEAMARAVAAFNAIAPGDLKGRASVSQGVVLRLLDAAGWDVFDPWQVRPGHSSGGRELSYALLTPQDGSGEPPSPRVLVEVRSPGESLEATRRVNRLLASCAREGAPLGVLTDGLVWRLFLPTAGEDQGDRGFCEMDLAGNPGAAAEDIGRYLARGRVASGEGFRMAERVLLERNRDEMNRRAIIEGWREVVGGMGEGLVALVATAAEQRTGIRPGDGLVRRVLGESRAGLLGSGAGSAAAHPAASRTRPVAFSLGPETRNVSSWGGLLVEVCLMMREREPGEFERILELRGRRNPYFSRVAGELLAPRAVGDTGIFTCCQGGGAQLAARARRVVEFFGYPPESLAIRTG